MTTYKTSLRSARSRQIDGVADLPRIALATLRRAKRRTIPNWKAIQAGEDAGAPLTDLWREYATTAPLPYHITTFRKEFRKWQSAAPVKPIEEYAASDAYWQGKVAVRPEILVLDDGATLRVRGGHLEIFNHGKTTHFPPGPHHRKPKAIIFAGWGGSFSIEASRFCVDHRITVLVIGWLGDLLTFIAPRPVQDASMVRAQCACSPVPIARAVILQKFLHYRATARLSPTQFKIFAARLAAAKTLSSILGIEAIGSSQAWVFWSGLSLHATNRPNPAAVAGYGVCSSVQRAWRARRKACNRSNQRNA
jgi:hypothetical protein